jgi:uncharacterized NAD(P)/FAD-binding protein YdhS
MLQILTTYSFETRAPAILGSSIENAKVVAILDFNTANKMFNITSRHANIYPHLPTGTPRNPEKYTYYLFETSNAKQECLADVWINMDSVKVVQADTTLITVYNTNSQDREKLRKLLLSTGYQQFSIEVS